MIARVSIRWVQELVDNGTDSGDFYVRMRPIIRKTTYVTNNDKETLKKALQKELKTKWRKI